MDPVHAGRVPGFQRARRGDVGRDHQLLDQPVAVVARRVADACHRAVVRKRDRAFRQLEIERAARLPRRPERAIDAVECGEHGPDRIREAVPAALCRRLHPFIGEPVGRAHERALEAPVAQRTARVDPEMRGEAGAIDPRPQRAEIGRQRLGQHRHHAVGEIGGIAALLRRPVQRAAGPDEMGHVGDGDHRAPASGIVGRGVGLGPHRIVEIAGVGAVDGHQRERAEVRPPVEARCLQPLGLGQCLVGEAQRQAVAVDRGQADRAGRIGVPQPLDHPRIRQAEAAALAGLPHHQLARTRAGGLARLHGEVAAQPALRRLDHAAAPAVGMEDADHPARAGIEHAHGPRLVAAVRRGPEPGEHAVAHPRLGNAPGRGVEDDRRRRLGRLPPRGPRRERAVRIEAVDLQHRDRRQRAGRSAPAAPPLDRAFRLQRAQQLGQRRAVVAADAEGAGDLAPAHPARALPDEAKHLIPARKGRRLACQGRRAPLRRAAGRRIRLPPRAALRLGPRCRVALGRRLPPAPGALFLAAALGRLGGEQLDRLLERERVGVGALGQRRAQPAMLGIGPVAAGAELHRLAAIGMGAELAQHAGAAALASAISTTARFSPTVSTLSPRGSER